MRKFLITMMALALAVAFIGQIRVNADTKDFRSEPHLRVLLTNDAQLIVDGKPYSLEQTERAIDDLKKRGGTFWYARQNGNQEPSPAQQKLFEELLGYVADAQLPVRLFTDGTFTTLVPM